MIGFRIRQRERTVDERFVLRASRSSGRGRPRPEVVDAGGLRKRGMKESDRKEAAVCVAEKTVNGTARVVLGTMNPKEEAT